MQNFDKAVFVGKLDQFKARALQGELLGNQFGIDCRLVSRTPVKTDAEAVVKVEKEVSA